MTALNNYTKKAIVAAIMADIPQPDHNRIKEDIQAALFKGMSIACRNLYKKSPKALLTMHVGYQHGLDYGVFITVGDADTDTVLKPFKDAYDTRKAVEQNLRSAIDACKTRKQFIDRFPEFSKYAPAEDGKTSNLPAIANVVADLVKLGWKQTISKTPQPA